MRFRRRVRSIIGDGVLLRAVLCCLAAFVSLWPRSMTAAAETYLAPDGFLAEAFGDSPPEPEAIWLTGDLRAQAEEVLGHPPSFLRQRYWRRGARTAWILEEIGKERPITAGFVIEKGRLVSVSVLIYRESRGWEIRYPYFRDQFVGAALGDSLKLSERIDGISGATLSVRAMRRMARLALLLHEAVMKGDGRG